MTEAFPGHTNHPCNFRYPLFVLTDDEYNAVGAVSIEDDGHYHGYATDGTRLFRRKEWHGMMSAAKSKGNMVSSAWYGVTNGRPQDHE